MGGMVMFVAGWAVAGASCFNTGAVVVVSTAGCVGWVVVFIVVVVVVGAATAGGCVVGGLVVESWADILARPSNSSEAKTWEDGGNVDERYQRR